MSRIGKNGRSTPKMFPHVVATELYLCHRFAMGANLKQFYRQYTKSSKTKWQ